jgi:FtsP/CotA-like multicopper oxidase with cupredoxin domain
MRRRDLLSTSLAAGVATAIARRAVAQPSPAPAPPPPAPPPAPATRAGDATASATGSALIVPDGRVLTGRKVGGARVFHLIAEPIRHEVAPGLVIDTWGYNGGTPGPVIEATEGERVRIYVTNKLPEPTTVHWHGVVCPTAWTASPG